MTLDDCQQAREADSVLGIIIKRLRERMLDQDWCKNTDSPKVSQYKREQNSLVLQKGILYRQARPRELDETLLQLVLPAAYREVALKGCHDEVGHLGLECMLDLMHDRFFWPHMAVQVKEHIGKCCPCLAFKARQPKAPLKKYHGHSSPGAGPSRFSMPGTWERPGRKCAGNNRPFHQVCPGICYKDPNGSYNGKDPVGQVHCPLWSSPKKY